MAWVVKGAGSGYHLSITVRDNQGDDTTKTYSLRAVDETAALADALTIIAELGDVSGAVPIRYRISKDFYEDTWSLPAAGINNGVKARMTALLVGNKNASYDIPAPLETIWEDTEGAGANNVDIDDPDVLAYGNIFAVGGQAFISDGDSLIANIKGKRVP